MARTRSTRQASPGTAIVVLLFAAIDLILALGMLLGGGFSWQFAVIALIGASLAFYGLKLVYFGPR